MRNKTKQSIIALPDYLRPLNAHSLVYANQYNMFCIGELSNFWMYIIYDLLKQGYDKKIIKSLKFVQLLWYAYFRIYRFTWFVIENNQIVLEMKFYNVIGLYSLYFLGIGWTHYQIRQLLV